MRRGIVIPVLVIIIVVAATLVVLWHYGGRKPTTVQRIVIYAYPDESIAMETPTSLPLPPKNVE